MLGHIDFKAWQCLCEIIDNSIDAFAADEINSEGGEGPCIKIKLPAQSATKLEPDNVLEITDNGQGMTKLQLEQSLRAGFSANDPTDKLGLFGMGFNISTARLGGRTEVITATKESEHLLKVTIDFQLLEQSGDFDAPIEIIPKKPEEKDYHGTKILITKLRVDHHKPLFQKQKMLKRLGKIYGRIIREKNIRIVYQGNRCKPFIHCTWSAGRSGQTRSGPVPAVIDIDHVIDVKRYCKTCWVWVPEREDTCLTCGQSHSVVKRDRRIKGWIGIQRYFDDVHYGIDLIRNGRVINELDKSLFYWTNEEEEEELEYPIDGHERKGRIVGELEIDFVAVSHQKDAFETGSADWGEVVRFIRGDGPIRPKIAKSYGYAENDSPLATLYGAFRGAKAGIKNLVPQRKNGQAMITDAHIDELVRKFENGDHGYDTDEKWWELLNSNGSGGQAAKDPDTDNPTGGSPFDAGETDDDVPPAGDSPAETEAGPDSAIEMQTERDPELSGAYTLDLFPKITIRVVAEKGLDKPNTDGFSVLARGAELTFIYWPTANIYTSALLTPADFLINELAYQLHTTAQNELSQVPLTLIELALREKYFPELHPNLEEVDRQINNFEADFREHLLSHSGSAIELNADALEEEQRDIIRKKLAKNQQASRKRIETVLSSSEFLAYASLEGLRQLLDERPELVFDEKFFSYLWSEVSQDALGFDLKRDLLLLLDDIVWFKDSSKDSFSSLWKGRMRRLIGSLEIANNWRM